MRTYKIIKNFGESKENPSHYELNICSIQRKQSYCHWILHNCTKSVADSGIFAKGGVPPLRLVFKGGSTIIFGFQRVVPLLKCIIFTLF
jgi:hypothetical protein